MNHALKKSISLMIVNGQRLELPKEVLANYAEVKRTLTKAGGKYKKNGFEFNCPAEQIKQRLVGGEKIDDKKKFQFFESTDALADDLIEKADIKPEHAVCEPSAGRARIAERIRRIVGDEKCTVVELMPENAQYLRDKGYDVTEADFLTTSAESLGTFDRIIANPPFSKNQDIDHVQHMYRLLKANGRLVSVMSPSWTFGSVAKQVRFREWLERVNAQVTELPEGTFKESGTNVGAVVVVIDKRSNEDSPAVAA